MIAVRNNQAIKPTDPGSKTQKSVTDIKQMQRKKHRKREIKIKRETED